MRLLLLLPTTTIKVRAQAPARARTQASRHPAAATERARPGPASNVSGTRGADEGPQQPAACTQASIERGGQGEMDWEDAAAVDMETEMEMAREEVAAEEAAAERAERAVREDRRAGEERGRAVTAAAAAVRDAEQLVAGVRSAKRTVDVVARVCRPARPADLRRRRAQERQREAEERRAHSDKKEKAARQVQWALVRAVMCGVLHRTWQKQRRKRRAVGAAGMSAPGRQRGDEGMKGDDAAYSGPPLSGDPFLGRPLTLPKAGVHRCTKSARLEIYEKMYPPTQEEPTRREGATGPERPQRKRPSGQQCYANGGEGAKRRRKAETGMPEGRPPGT